MTNKKQFEYGQYFYHFGVKTESLSEGPPLVCLNGGIMADTGGESLSYIYACQDRYPVYAALGGMRCLLFTQDDEHLQYYQNIIIDVSRHLETICSVTKLFPAVNIPEPLYMPCNIDNLDVPLCPNEKFLQQIRNPHVINNHVRGGVYLNQLSPTISLLLSQFYSFLRDSGYDLQVRLDEYHRMAQGALKWHNKSNYVELLQKHKKTDTLPPHIPTAIFTSEHLKNLTWDRLKQLVREQTGNTRAESFFVKSGMDAAGEVSVILNRNNFSVKSRDLTGEIAIKVNDMNRTASEIPLLVQPCIERSDNENHWPTSVGITYNIHDTEHIERLVIAGHVNKDTERKTFMGSYLSDDLTQHVLQVVGEDKIIMLLQFFAKQGYRGPINLDAVRNKQGNYIFIYDCYPRLGGSFPILILKKAFEQAGLQVHTLLSLGYRGRIIYPNLKAKLSELADLGLLYTRNRQRGVFILPSVVRPDSFDLILINMEMDEIRNFIGSDLIHTLSDKQQCDLRGVYL